MTEANSSNQNFITKLTEIILSNLEKENFGVNELASAAGMTSSSLRRKLHAVSEKSINQLIREVRLQKAMEMLQEEDVTASEVAYKVGFGSPAYFSKCFHDHFNYTPGEVKKRENEDIVDYNGTFNHNMAEEAENPMSKKPIRRISIYTAGSVLILFIIYLVFNNLSLESFSILPGDRIISEDKSVAVVSFENLSSDEENQHFADGITRNIIHNLTQISGLKVINDPLTGQLDNISNKKKLADKLNVRFFLGGSVQKSGEQVLVLVQLTDITKNQIIWSDKYDGKTSDIFMVQSDIAKQLATKLQTVITKREKEQIEKIPTRNSEAHELYIKGRYFLNRRSGDGTLKSINYFKKAIEADYTYAEAYAGLADAYSAFRNDTEHSTNERYAMAKKLTLRALELNNSLAEAHASMGSILYYGEWKWEEARKEFLLAIKLNPNSATVRHYYSDLLCILNEYDEARVQINLAYKLNPTSTRILLSSCSLYIREAKYSEALEECSKVVEFDPDYYAIYWRYFNIYCLQGEEIKAVDTLKKALSFFPENDKFTNNVHKVYKQSGMTGIFNMLVEQISEDDETRVIVKAKHYSRLGEKEKALDCLEEALESHNLGLPYNLGDPIFHGLRNEPRFQTLLDKTGLSVYYRNAGIKTLPQ